MRRVDFHEQGASEQRRADRRMGQLQGQSELGSVEGLREQREDTEGSRLKEQGRGILRALPESPCPHLHLRQLFANRPVRPNHLRNLKKKNISGTTQLRGLVGPG